MRDKRRIIPFLNNFSASWKKHAPDLGLFEIMNMLRKKVQRSFL